MHVPYVVVAALMPAVVLAAPVAKPQTNIPGFTRNALLPKWVLPLAEIPRTERTDPVVLRLNEVQAVVGAVPATTINRAIQVNDSSELGVIGQYAINYFAQYQKLVLHRVMILRGDQRLDRTASVNVRPLQRETNIESGMLGGATTVQLLLDDVRIGDTLWISYTIEGDNPVMGKRWSADFHWDSGSPIELRRLTVLHPRNRPLAWRQLGDFQTGKLTPQIELAGDMERMRFEERGLEAVESEPSVPSDYMPVRMLQFTEYQDWNGVANWADSLFPKAAASPALKALARQFADEADAETRAAAALHWVQNEIRYFSVSVGENSHRPQLPDVVLQRRYGDCKDKSYLLVSLLRELGVKAQPLLLSASAPKFAAKVLPTPSWFNHVIVQITIDGHDYYVDPTRVNQPEPLAAMPIAFPGAQVLLIDPAAKALTTIPERSETQPTFEHNEEISVADFSGAATLVTRDVYRSTYADAMRVYFTRMSVSEQKKSALAKYEKLYPGVSLDGVPVYQDIVAENRVEITSQFKLPKAVILKDKRYQVAFSTAIMEDTLGIPSKLVRNFPFEPAGGLYSGRYRLRIHWPAQVRRNDAPHLKMVDNPYFQVREEYAVTGNEADYLMDYRLKQRTVAASELPELGQQSKLLNEFAEGGLRIEESFVTPANLQAYTLRDLESLRDTNDVMERMAQLKGRKDQDITLTEACDYVNSQHQLDDFISVEAIQLARRMEKLVMEAKPQPGLGACKAELSFAAGKYSAGLEALAADPLKDDANPLMRELAWAQFHAGDTPAALATMARYRAARELASGGMTDPADAASQIALLQRTGQPIPLALERFARELQDGPWPHPVLAMQLGLLSQEKLLRQAEAMSRDSKALALNDAWFYIGQARLAANDVTGAVQAFRWLNGNGLRNHSLTRQARHETRVLFERDRHADAGLKAVLKKDLTAAIATWRKGEEAGSAASYHGLGLAALNGQGLPKSQEQALRWFQHAADQGYPESQAMLGVMYLYGMGTSRDAEKGLTWLRAAAAQHDANAQYELGARYRWGRDVGRDPAQARHWLQRAADQGQADAMAALGAMCRNGEGAPKDYVQAEFWHRRGVMYGNANAMYGLATAYEYGEAVARDYARAALLYRGAAELKHSDGAVNLGLLYESGKGVKQDYAEARSWYLRATEQGNHYGARNLALMYLNGRGGAPDPRLGAQYNRKAIELGSTTALAGLGHQYHTGTGVTQDYTQARKLYEQAAERRDALGEYFLAELYENGLGVEADAKLALQWYRRSAEDGDLDAQYKLAQALYHGDEVAQDRKEAAEWYAKSAAQGLAAAQGKLGEMYLFGRGVPSDKPQAMVLLRQAAAQGFEEAVVHLGQAYENGWGVERDAAQAIAWYEKAPGLLNAKVRLGNLYLGAGKNEERGRRLLREADATPVTSGDFGTLGWIYSSVGNKAKAEWAYLRGLELAERTPGAEDAHLLYYLNLVTSFFKLSDQPEKAEPMMRRRLQLMEKVFDAKSAQMEKPLEDLGDLYQNLDRYADSEAFYQRALALKEALYGARSVQVAAMLESMSGLFLQADQFDKAEVLARRALALSEELNDPEESTDMRQLAKILMAKGEYAEAEKFLLRSLALQEKRLGKDSARLCSPLNTLGVIYDMQHAYDKADAALERALELHRSNPNAGPFEAAIYQTNLAKVRIGQKKYAEAEALLLESQATKARILDDAHPELSYGLYALGLLYQSQGQYDKALAPLKQALTLRDGTRGYGGDSMISEVLQALGEVYSAQGLDEMAEPLFLRAVAMRSRIMDERHPALKQTRRSLAELHRKSARV